MIPTGKCPRSRRGFRPWAAAGPWGSSAGHIYGTRTVPPVGARSRAPEAFVGGPIAAVREGDIIHFDIQNRTLNLELGADEIAARLKNFASRAFRDRPWGLRSG